MRLPRCKDLIPAYRQECPVNLTDAELHKSDINVSGRIYIIWTKRVPSCHNPGIVGISGSSIANDIGICLNNLIAARRDLIVIERLVSVAIGFVADTDFQNYGVSKRIFKCDLVWHVDLFLLNAGNYEALGDRKMILPASLNLGPLVH